MVGRDGDLIRHDMHGWGSADVSRRPLIRYSNSLIYSANFSIHREEGSGRLTFVRLGSARVLGQVNSELNLMIIVN